MNRAEFLKILGLGAVGLALPPSLVKRHTVKIYDNYLRGTAYYYAEKLLSIIKEGDELQLKREPDNVYDCFAIAVYYYGYKLGYIPAYENIVLANMLDKGVNLHAFVSLCDPDENMYRAIAIEVYADLIAPTEKLLSAMEDKRADELVDIYRQYHNWIDAGDFTD